MPAPRIPESNFRLRDIHPRAVEIIVPTAQAFAARYPSGLDPHTEFVAMNNGPARYGFDRFSWPSRIAQVIGVHGHPAIQRWYASAPQPVLERFLRSRVVGVMAHLRADQLWLAGAEEELITVIAEASGERPETVYHALQEVDFDLDAARAERLYRPAEQKLRAQLRTELRVPDLARARDRLCDGPFLFIDQALMVHHARGADGPLVQAIARYVGECARSGRWDTPPDISPGMPSPRGRLVSHFLAVGEQLNQRDAFGDTDEEGMPFLPVEDVLEAIWRSVDVSLTMERTGWPWRDSRVAAQEPDNVAKPDRSAATSAQLNYGRAALVPLTEFWRPMPEPLIELPGLPAAFTERYREFLYAFLGDFPSACDPFVQVFPTNESENESDQDVCEYPNAIGVAIGVREDLLRMHGDAEAFDDDRWRWAARYVAPYSVAKLRLKMMRANGTIERLYGEVARNLGMDGELFRMSFDDAPFKSVVDGAKIDAFREAVVENWYGHETALSSPDGFILAMIGGWADNAQDDNPFVAAVCDAFKWAAWRDLWDQVPTRDGGHKLDPVDALAVRFAAASEGRAADLSTITAEACQAVPDKTREAAARSLVNSGWLSAKRASALLQRSGGYERIGFGADREVIEREVNDAAQRRVDFLLEVADLGPNALDRDEHSNMRSGAVLALATINERGLRLLAAQPEPQRVSIATTLSRYQEVILERRQQVQIETARRLAEDPARAERMPSGEMITLADLVDPPGAWNEVTGGLHDFFESDGHTVGKFGPEHGGEPGAEPARPPRIDPSLPGAPQQLEERDDTQGAHVTRNAEGQAGESPGPEAAPDVDETKDKLARGTSRQTNDVTRAPDQHPARRGSGRHAPRGPSRRHVAAQVAGASPDGDSQRGSRHARHTPAATAPPGATTAGPSQGSSSRRRHHFAAQQPAPYAGADQEVTTREDGAPAAEAAPVVTAPGTPAPADGTDMRLPTPVLSPTRG